MAWSRLQSASTSIASGTTGAATYGTNLTSGTKLVVLVTVASTTTSTVKDGAGNSWTKLSAINANGVELSLWALDTPAGDAGTKPTITATFAAACNGGGILIQEVSGLLAGNTTAMADGTPGTESANTTVTTTSPTYSSTALNEYLVACYGDDGLTQALTWTAPGGYTADPNAINSNGSSNCAISYKNSTNGAESGNYTQSATADDKVQILGAFQLAATAAAGYGSPSLPPVSFGPLSRTFGPNPPFVPEAPLPGSPVVTGPAPAAPRRPVSPAVLPRRGAARAAGPATSGVSQPPIPPVSVRDVRREPRIPPRGSAPSWQRGISQPPVPPQAVRDVRREPRVPPRAVTAAAPPLAAPPLPPQALRDTRRPARIPPRSSLAQWQQGVSQPPVPPQAVRDARRPVRIPSRGSAPGWDKGVSQPPVPPQAVRDGRRPVRFPAHQAASPPSAGFTPPAASRAPQPLRDWARLIIQARWKRQAQVTPPQAAAPVVTFAPQPGRPLLRRPLGRRGAAVTPPQPSPPLPPVLAAPRRPRFLPRRGSTAQWDKGIPQPPVPPQALRDTRRPGRFPRATPAMPVPPQVIIPPAAPAPRVPRRPWTFRLPWWARRSAIGYLPGRTAGIIKATGTSSVADPRDGTATLKAAASGQPGTTAKGTGTTGTTAPVTGQPTVTDPRDGSGKVS